MEPTGPLASENVHGNWCKTQDGTWTPIVRIRRMGDELLPGSLLDLEAELEEEEELAWA